MLNINELAQRAGEVAQKADENEAAISAERDAEAAALEAAIAAICPALRALSSRLKRSSYTTGGQNGCNPVERYEYFDERGLVLVDNYSRERDESGNRGEFDGTCLVVLTDGSLVKLTRAGSFSHWQGEANEWAAELVHLSARQAMDEFDLSDCLVGIENALSEQLTGDKSKRTKAALERAEKLRAITSLAK